MDRTERFYKIEMMIRAQGCTSFEQMQAVLEVSKATLKRDLQYLRTRMDAPIVYDRIDNSYKLQADPRDQRQVSHQLPGVWFSEREIHAMLTMHQLIQGLDAGGVLARHLHPMLDKLHGMLGASEADPDQLMKRVKIVNAANRPVPVKWFELVGDALMKRLRVQMRYQTRGRNVMTEREVSPQRLVHYRSTWYLDAWCHKRDGLLRFALDSVDHAEVLTKRAKEVSLNTVQAEMDGGFGIFAGNNVQWATLVFSASAAAWVSREQWHAEQLGRWLDDGRYELKLPFTEETELLMEVLRQGGQVEVVSPASLRTLVEQRLREALKVYA